MRKIAYILYLSILMTACQKEVPLQENKGISIRVSTNKSFQTRVINEDNLADEQIINNISLFFTDPASTTILYKYVNTGFTVSGDYQLITLPIEPADLLMKDIYVVANYDDLSLLDALTTLDGLKGLITPEVDKTNNLSPQNGFCMYGSLAGFDFTANTDIPATIPLIRTCAKIRINLSFPENDAMSTVNSFLIQHAAKYTHVISNAVMVLPVSDYFNFAAAIGLTDNGGGVYTNTVYVYEASSAPVITLYTHINNSVEQQEFTTTLPVPVRNYLYDLQIEVMDESDAATRATTYRSYKVIKSRLDIYNESGQLIEQVNLNEF